MSLPYNTSIVAAQMSHSDPGGDLRVNLVEVPHTVDVSGIEADSAVTTAISSSGSNYVSQGIENGDATGVGTTDIDTPAGGASLALAANVPIAHTMSTSASDLDADDWINWHYDETGSPDPGKPSVHVNFVFGIPGGIA